MVMVRRTELVLDQDETALGDQSFACDDICVKGADIILDLQDFEPLRPIADGF